MFYQIDIINGFYILVPIPPPNPFAAPVSCVTTSEFRTIDGTCNNLQFPLWGSAKTPQLRMIAQNRYEDGKDIVVIVFCI